VRPVGIAWWVVKWVGSRGEGVRYSRPWSSRSHLLVLDYEMLLPGYNERENASDSIIRNESTLRL
jgi:hypothetical protein